MLLRRLRSLLSFERVQVGIGHCGKVRGRSGGRDAGMEIRGRDTGQRDGAIEVAVRIFAAHGGEDDGEGGGRRLRSWWLSV
jgi:hypothetical protein